RPLVFIAIDMPRFFMSAIRSRRLGASNGSPYIFGWMSGLTAMISSSTLRDASRSITPLTDSIALLSSEPQTGHIGQRRLHLVARSSNTRGGNAGTSIGVRASVGSTQLACDQSGIVKIHFYLN